MVEYTARAMEENKKLIDENFPRVAKYLKKYPYLPSPAKEIHYYLDT